MLARFEAFSASEFPGVDTLTEASVQAWITAAQKRAVKRATLQVLAAPVRELARWLGRRGIDAYLLPDQPNIPQVSISEGGQISARGETAQPCGDPLGLLVDGGHGDLPNCVTLNYHRWPPSDVMHGTKLRF